MQIYGCQSLATAGHTAVGNAAMLNLKFIVGNNNEKFSDDKLSGKEQ